MREFDRTKMEYPSVRTRYSKVNITETSVPPECADLSAFDPALVAHAEKIAGESGAEIITTVDVGETVFSGKGFPMILGVRPVAVLSISMTLPQSGA